MPESGARRDGDVVPGVATLESRIDDAACAETEQVPTSVHWSSMREAGTLYGLRFLAWINDCFGRRLLSLLLVPTAAYFWVFRTHARRSSSRYLSQHYRFYPQLWTNPPGRFASLKHLYVFAESVVDKLLSWHVEIQEERFRLEDESKVEQILADRRGQLIIGSHFGNLEYCRGFMQRYKDKEINILVHDKHSENYNAMMARFDPSSRVNVYQVSEFNAVSVLAMKKKIDNGEWLFIAGDRLPLSGHDRTVPVDFLGRQAHFPVGPYLLAKGLKCPVKLMFSYCDYFAEGRPVYFRIVDFADRIELPRKKRLAQLEAYAIRFAQELEQQCRDAPFHWFNFYDFWAGQPAYSDAST
ncbi:MAG: hypothetical protein AAGI88_13860 [Pseudomonadota bacterium]